jgi:hypothetical protein
VLDDIPKPVEEPILPMPRVKVASCIQEHVPLTPATPASAEAAALLHDLIKQDASALDATTRQRLERNLQKLTHATQRSFPAMDLLREHNQFLIQIDNESQVRRSTRSEVIGTARVMSYEDLEKARAERAAKRAATEAKKAEKQAKKAVKEAQKSAAATPAAEEAEAGKRKRGRKRKTAPSEADTAGPKKVRICEQEANMQVAWTRDVGEC